MGMASQWGSVGLVQCPQKLGDICWTMGIDDWKCLVLYCGEVWEAFNGDKGPFLSTKRTGDPPFAKRGQLLRRFEAKLDALVDEAREEARLLEALEGHLW